MKALEEKELDHLIDEIAPRSRLKIDKDTYTVLQHIIWKQHRAGYTYDKWVLADKNDEPKYRLFIDSKEQVIGLAAIFHHPFQEPLPKRLTFQGNEYELTWSEFCTVVKAEGESFYKKGEAEIWWDYVMRGDNTKGLSLGRSWETWEREDLQTRFLQPDDIKLL